MQSYLVVAHSMMLRPMSESSNHVDQTKASVQTNKSTKSRTNIHTALEVERCAMQKEVDIGATATSLYASRTRGEAELLRQPTGLLQAF
jgi:hypothetical protein